MLQVTQWRQSDCRIVFTNGCFDLLHRGHRHALREAAAQGDRLIVAVNSDASVRGLKGPSRPIQDQSHRSELIADLVYVDAVIVFDAVDPGELIERIRPDVLVKGADWRSREVAGAGYADRLHFVEPIEGVSTTRIIEEMGYAAASEHSRGTG
jgi:D-beta-D-heptose 7-phosphate kinase/D-beta-D-heptose 1-phosphate adenosyltransferase